MDAKSVRCDLYPGQVLEEKVPFPKYCSWANRSALWGVLCVVDFPMRQVLPAKCGASVLCQNGLPFYATMFCHMLRVQLEFGAPPTWVWRNSANQCKCSCEGLSWLLWRCLQYCLTTRSSFSFAWLYRLIWATICAYATLRLGMRQTQVELAPRQIILAQSGKSFWQRAASANSTWVLRNSQPEFCAHTKRPVEACQRAKLTQARQSCEQLSRNCECSSREPLHQLSSGAKLMLVKPQNSSWIDSKIYVKRAILRPITLSRDNGVCRA